MDWEAPPLGPGQQAAQPGEDEPVTGAVARAPSLAAKDPDFMAQDEELDVTGEVPPRPNEEQVEQQSDERVHGGVQHGRGSSPQPLPNGHRSRPTQYGQPPGSTDRALIQRRGAGQRSYLRVSSAGSPPPFAREARTPRICLPEPEPGQQTRAIVGGKRGRLWGIVGGLSVSATRRSAETVYEAAITHGTRTEGG